MHAALAIGYLFKSVPIPSEFGPKIISHLKIISLDNNLLDSINSFIALSCLTECECI